MNGGEVNYGWREGRCNALDISLKHMVGYMATDPLRTPWQVTSRRESLISKSALITVGSLLRVDVFNLISVKEHSSNECIRLMCLTQVDKENCALVDNKAAKWLYEK